MRQEARDEAEANNLRVYPTAQDLFADPAIDVIIIATPNDSHKDYIIHKGLRLVNMLFAKNLLS